MKANSLAEHVLILRFYTAILSELLKNYEFLAYLPTTPRTNPTSNLIKFSNLVRLFALEVYTANKYPTDLQETIPNQPTSKDSNFINHTNNRSPSTSSIDTTRSILSCLVIRLILNLGIL